MTWRQILYFCNPKPQRPHCVFTLCLLQNICDIFREFSHRISQVKMQHFTLQNKEWYFVTKIGLTYCEKELFYWSRKTFEIQGWRPRICKFFEITRTIYSSSEWSEQFLVPECFLTCSWRFLMYNKSEQLWSTLEKNIGI